MREQQVIDNPGQKMNTREPWERRAHKR